MCRSCCIVLYIAHIWGLQESLVRRRPCSTGNILYSAQTIIPFTLVTFFFANVGLLRVYAKFSVNKYHGLPTRAPFHATAGAHKSTWGDRPFLFHSLKVVVVSIYGGVPVAIVAAMAFVDICPPPTMVFVLLLCLGWIWALVWRQLKTKEQLWFSVNYFNMTRSDDPKT